MAVISRERASSGGGGRGKLVLLLDDVLSRVPTRALKPGLHDPSRELHFELEELIDGITLGRPTISLSKLAARYPDTFATLESAGEDVPINLPLQKLIQQIPVPADSASAGVPVSRATEAGLAAEFEKELPANTPESEIPAAELPPTLHVAPQPLRKLEVFPPGVDPRPPAGEQAAEVSASEAPSRPPASSSAWRDGETTHPAVPPSATAGSAQPWPKVGPTISVPPVPQEQLSPPEILAATSPGTTSPASPPEPLFTALPRPVAPEAGIPVPGSCSPVSPGEPAAAAAPPLQPEPNRNPSAASPTPSPTAPESGAASEASAPVMRFSTGRPNIRPPSIHGPSGVVVPETPATAAPAVPGFVFAPRPSTPLSDAPVPVPEVHEPAVSEVVIPPLFSLRRPAGASSLGSAGTASGRSAGGPSPASAGEPAAMQEMDAPIQQAFVGARPADSEEPESVPDAVVEADSVEEASSSRERQIEPKSRQDSIGRGNELLGVHFSLARIDQEPLQAIFMTEEFLDLPRVSQLSCRFPGVTGCLIVAGDALAHGGDRPAGLDGPALCKLTKQLAATAAEYPEELPAVQTFTLHTGNKALSIFARQYVSMCVVHSHRGFLPGVRERLAAVADTLSRGLSGEVEAEPE